VLEKHPELETVGMMVYRYPRLLRGPADYRADAPDGRPWRALLLPAVEDREDSPVDPAGRVDITSSADRRGTLRFRIPEGCWALAFLFVRTQYDATHSMISYSEPRRYINLLDRRAGEAFVAVTHERFFRAVGRSFGRSIRAIFTDEPSLQPPLFSGQWPYTSLPWRADLPEAFRRRFGRPVDEALLAAGLSDVGPRSAALRCDFWELVAEECSRGFFKPIEDWCARRGLAATGHLLWEEEVNRHVAFEGSYYAAMRRFHIPGIDMLTSRPETLMRVCMTPKLASSAAHLLGRAEVMSEASNHEERMRREKRVTPAEIRASMNWHYALGVNAITSYYDLDRFSDAEMRRLNAHVCRLGTMLRRGEHVAPVAVLYPEQSLWAATVRGLPGREMLALEAAFKGVTESLLTAQIDFDYLDERALRAARVRSGRLLAGSRSYAALVLPRIAVLDRKLSSAIRRAASAGVGVIFVGTLPSISREKGGDAALRRVFARLAAAGKVVLVPEAGPRLTSRLKPLADVRAFPDSNRLLVHHRREKDRDIFFVANMSRAAYRGSLAFAASGRVREWDPGNGSSREIPARAQGGKTRAAVSIPGLGARFFTIEKG
jgi:hypothetical protein